MEADFQREYRIDLREVLANDSMGCRRLWALIDGLPSRSALVRATTFNDVEWGSLEELLADLIEHVDATNRILRVGLPGIKTEMQRPYKVRRPWVKSQPKALSGRDFGHELQRIGKEMAAMGGEQTDFVVHVPKGGEMN